MNKLEQATTIALNIILSPFIITVCGIAGVIAGILTIYDSCIPGPGFSVKKRLVKNFTAVLPDDDER